MNLIEIIYLNAWNRGWKIMKGLFHMSNEKEPLLDIEEYVKQMNILNQEYLKNIHQTLPIMYVIMLCCLEL